MGPLKNIKLVDDKLLFLTLLLSTVFQISEIVDFIHGFMNDHVFYVYFLKVIPILLLCYVFLFDFTNIKKEKVIYPFLFAIIYSIFEFNGVNNIEQFNGLIPSFFSILSLVFLVYFWGSRDRIQCSFLTITRIVFLTPGIIVLAINIFDGGFNINIYLYLGLLISIPRSYIISPFFFFASFFWAFFSENRTILLIVICNVVIYFFGRKIFSYPRLFLLLLLIITITSYLFVFIEADTWFTHAILSGRAGISNYWLDILNGNLRYTLIGIGLRSDDYVNFSLIGDHVNSIGYFSQFHSAFIATLVRGGWLLLFINLAYITYLLRKSNLDIDRSYVAFSLAIFLSLNMSFDYFYPSVFGSMLLFSIVGERRKERLLPS